MPVTQQTPLISYTANGSTTVFAYPFRVINAADLKVYVNGVERTTGMSISGVGNANGGSVTLTPAPANGSIIRLQRSTSTDRSIDYGAGGNLSATSLDNDFERIVMMIQEVKTTSSLESPD